MNLYELTIHQAHELGLHRHGYLHVSRVAIARQAKQVLQVEMLAVLTNANDKDSILVKTFKTLATGVAFGSLVLSGCGTAPVEGDLAQLQQFVARRLGRSVSRENSDE